MTAAFPEKIDALTGLRFFMALAIVLHHLCGVMFVKPGAFGTLALAQGVSFFFILSGFVLQHAYRTRITTVGPLRFVGLRFARLWPVHMAVIGIVALLGGQIFFDDFVYQLFLVQAWRPMLGDVYAINGPAWSISVELFFYALFPFLTAPAAKRPLLLLTGASILTGLYLFAITWADQQGVNVNAYSRVNPLGRVFEFILGMTAYELAQRWRTPKGSWVEIAVVALTWFVFVRVSEYTAIHSVKPVEEWLRLTGSAPAFALAIVVLARQSGIISTTLSWRPLVYLGDLSFALYLVHHPIIVYFEHHPMHLPPIAQIVLFTGGLFALCAALHHGVELPAMNWARRFLARKRPTQIVLPNSAGSEDKNLIPVRTDQPPSEGR
ncbi:MAG: acyltransferase [Caulobacterales bacterium]